MADELLKLQELQEKACDPRTDETCDLSEIIEALKSLGDLDDPFVQLRSVTKGQIILVNMMVWLL